MQDLSDRRLSDGALETSGSAPGYTGAGRLFAVGGVGASLGTLDSLEESDLGAGGTNGAWRVNGKKGPNAAGVMAFVANNKLFALGGATGANDASFSGALSGGRDSEFDASGNLSGSISSTSNGLLMPRGLGVPIRGSGFFYFVGGTSDGSNAVATTERSF